MIKFPSLQPIVTITVTVHSIFWRLWMLGNYHNYTPKSGGGKLNALSP